MLILKIYWKNSVGNGIAVEDQSVKGTLWKDACNVKIIEKNYCTYVYIHEI